jgi:hypothetical protein
MKLLIILLVVIGFILGPIMMLRPSPAQKRREQWRTRARAQGVHFSMRKLPQQADEAEAPDALPVYFYVPRSQGEGDNWLLIRTNYQHDLNLLGWWAWATSIRPSEAELECLHDLLPKLPQSVKALSSGGQGTSIYWGETGTEDDLVRVLGSLKKLNSLQQP